MYNIPMMMESIIRCHQHLYVFLMSLMAAHLADQELVKQAMEVDRRHDEQLLALQQALRGAVAPVAAPFHDEGHR